MRRTAVFSRCGNYRYALGREWRPAGRTILFIALNPSTADRTTDDPTIRRCIGFARQWGFARMIVANLFAWRSTDPRQLAAVADPVGPRNDWWLKRSAANADLIVAAWGVRGGLKNRAHQVMQHLEALHHLGLTRCGQPRHPLYLPRTATPSPLRSARLTSSY